MPGTPGCSTSCVLSRLKRTTGHGLPVFQHLVDLLDATGRLAHRPTARRLHRGRVRTACGMAWRRYAGRSGGFAARPPGPHSPERRGRGGAGDDAVLRTMVAADPAAAITKGGPRSWDPL